MNKHITLLLILLVLTAAFGVNSQLKINSINKTIDCAETILVNGYINKSNLNYNFELVEKEPTKENIEALAREIIFSQHMFSSIITLNKDRLQKDMWRQFESSREEKSVNYVFSLINKSQMSEQDKENLSKLKDIYNTFYYSTLRDTASFTITNIDSLTGSYVDLIKQIQELFSV